MCVCAHTDTHRLEPYNCHTLGVIIKIPKITVNEHYGKERMYNQDHRLEMPKRPRDSVYRPVGKSRL